MMIEHDIKNALKNKGCLVCNIVKDRMDEKLKWFKLENYHDISTLESLKTYPYICERHKHELLSAGNVLTVTFEFLIDKDIDFFKALLDTGGKKLKNRIKKTDFNVCKFCQEEKKIEQFVIDTFIKMIESEETRLLYRKSDGLCRKHLMQCLTTMEKNDEKSVFIINDAIEKLSKIKSSIKIFFHKSDYRFAKEEKGEEQKAWLEALNFYSNNKK